MMVSDHVATTPDIQGLYPAPFYDPFVTLAWLAGSTRKLEPGTTVASDTRYPALAGLKNILAGSR